jgi:S-adenosylmethionine synthetase
MGQKIKVMDLRTRKYTAIEKIMHFDEKAMEKLEQTINNLLDQRISIEQYNKELEDANTRIEAGDYVSHEDVVKESASWLK